MGQCVLWWSALKCPSGRPMRFRRMSNGCELPSLKCDHCARFRSPWRHRPATELLQIAQKRRRPHNIARPRRLGEPLAGLGLGQLTVTVTLAEWLSVPDRPVTITLVAAGLVCDL